MVDGFLLEQTTYFKIKWKPKKGISNINKTNLFRNINSRRNLSSLVPILALVLGQDEDKDMKSVFIQSVVSVIQSIYLIRIKIPIFF